MLHNLKRVAFTGFIAAATFIASASAEAYSKNDVRVTLDQIRDDIVAFEHSEKSRLGMYLTLKDAYKAISFKASTVDPFLIYNPSLIDDRVLLYQVDEFLQRGLLANPPTRVLNPAYLRLVSAQNTMIASRTPVLTASKVVITSLLRLIRSEVGRFGHSEQARLGMYLSLKHSYQNISLGKNSTVNPYLSWTPEAIDDAVLFYQVDEFLSAGLLANPPTRIMNPSYLNMVNALHTMMAQRQ